MKSKLLLSLFMLACSIPLLAQSKTTNLQDQIVGTWKMISFSGTNANGKPFKTDLTKFTQYKIITPTHWMFVAYDSDSLTGGGNGGTYELKGSKYIETLTDNAKTDFTVKVEGDKYYQDGAILLPDGRKIVLHEVYQRVSEPATSATSTDVGVWNMTSYQITRDGKKTNEKGITELQINTPTHFMFVDKKDGKFLNAMFGKYTRGANNKIITTPIIASFPIDTKEKTDITSAIKGDQMISTVKITHGDGKTEQWDMVHQRVGKPKLAKAVSVK